MFTRTYKYQSLVNREEFKNHLIGEHVKIHDLDFEVFEKDDALRIIPHAEQIRKIKTLPVTEVKLKEEGNKTRVTITSKMRKFDSGGPQLIVILCGFLLGVAVTFQYLSGETMATYIILAVDALILTLFIVRMQMGYFDYIRKIRAYIKAKGEEISKKSSMLVEG